MGQYYIPVALPVERSDESRSALKKWYSHNYDNGLKLMEHSYVRNEFVGAVAHYLINNPCRLWWLGDYSEADDLPELGLVGFQLLYSFAWRNENGEREDSISEWHHSYPYILNHSKHAYISMKTYLHNNLPDKYWCMISPLPLLTAVGNGRGGGDYYGINENFIGTWAGDIIEITNKQPIAEEGDQPWTEVMIQFMEGGNVC